MWQQPDNDIVICDFCHDAGCHQMPMGCLLCDECLCVEEECECEENLVKKE